MASFNIKRTFMSLSSKRFSMDVFKGAVELPKLEYGYGDLAPVLSADLVETHHAKHHQLYVTNYNKAIVDLENAVKEQNLNKIISLQSAIKFNGGSHINHSIYWTNLAPVNRGGGVEPSENSTFRKHLENTWGSLENFKTDFNARTATIQGSGWGWLVYDKNSKQLRYLDLPNQDPVCMFPNLVPLFTIDIWEHAFYLSYKNVKADYLKNIWQVVNWANLEQRYNEATNI